MSDNVSNCFRCQTRLRFAPVAGSRARMLKRNETGRGLCVNCAVHNWLRHTYPCNMLLAQGEPEMLLHPQVQAHFAEIMRAAQADADPDEVSWETIVSQWDLPFPDPVRRTAQNPLDEADLARLKEEAQQRHAGTPRRFPPRPGL